MQHPRGSRWAGKIATRTIARDLIFGLVTIVTLVAGGFIGLNYLVLSRHNQAQFEQKTGEYLSYLQDSLAAPLWNFDHETIKPIAESLVKNEIVAKLRVYDYNQNEIFKGLDPHLTKITPINRSVDVLYQGKFVGRVQLVFSAHVIKERNRQLLATSLLTLGVIVLALISATGLLLKFLLGRPMNQVHQTMAKIAEGDYQSRADMPPQAEIAHIIQQFNRMAEQIQLREKALTDTNLRFEAILDNATAVFYLKDTKGRYLLVNKQFEALVNIDRQDIIGFMDQDIFPPEVAETFRANDQMVLESKTPIEFEEITPHGDKIYTYLSVKFPLEDSQGITYAVCGISTDITRRNLAEQEVRKLNRELESRVKRRTNALIQSNQQLKSEMSERLRAEAALRNNEDLLLATLESTADGILVIQHNEVTHANQRFWQMWEFPKETANKMQINAIRSHIKTRLVDTEDYQENLNRLYQSHEESLDILRLKDRRIFERYSCPLIIDHQTQGRVWCFRDISNIKQAEATMARAKNAAEAANRAKSNFLASMSHEIRTPMNGVIGMTGLLLQTNLDKEQLEFATTVRTSAESLLTIINDILDFSKIEAGKLELETINFDLETAVEEVAEMLAYGAYQKGLSFGCLIHPGVPQFLVGDPGRLRQIIVNLVSNAIKFTDEGHVAIKVQLESDTDTQAMLRFSVSDTGIGIPAERRNRLFKSFSQVDASTTRKYGGTGLGLAISKKLAQLLGGQIGVESSGGEGTTFWFTAVFAKQDQRDPSTSEPYQAIRDKRILAVVGNRVDREILETYLDHWGGSFSTAVDGRSALTNLQEANDSGRAFDLVIFDHTLAEKDDEAIAAAIKTDPHAKTVLLRLNSLESNNADTPEAVPKFEASITKPVKRSRLLHQVSTLLGGANGESPSTADSTQHTEILSDQTPSKNIRILVVEDNTTNQKVARHILTKFGCHADVVGNGEEAVEAFRHIPYNLILMDIQMPVMDGLTATRKIRTLESTARHGSLVHPNRTPIVALTANVMKGDREKCMKAGMDDFLGKPIDPEEVWKKIDHWALHAPSPLSTINPDETLRN